MGLTAFILSSIILSGYSIESSEFRFHGLRIFVDNLNKAEIFYTEHLGFEAQSRTNNQIELMTGSWPIYLQEINGLNNSFDRTQARTGLAIQTYKLLPRIDEFRQKKIYLFDSLLSRNGVGISIPFKDPSGNRLSLIEVQIRQLKPFDELKIYNTGVTIRNMDLAIDFYENILGFEEWSRAYLPEAMPLKHSNGTFAFMIHKSESVTGKNLKKYGFHPQMVLILETSDIQSAYAFLVTREIDVQMNGNKILCKDFENNSIEIIDN